MALIALSVCLTCILTILFLNRDRSLSGQTILWLPTAWLATIGSRPVSAWLGGGTGGGTLDSALEGNSTDAMFLSVLLAAGILVLAKRYKEVSHSLRSNLPVVMYFAYCLVSICWSPFPDVAFKRWMRALGDLVMVLLIVTSGHPFSALNRVITRVGAVLLTFSLYLIRYSDLGRGYDPDGRPMNTGVTTNKNTLGLVAFVIGLTAVSGLLVILKRKDVDRWRRLLAQAGVVTLVIAVLGVAHSATSVACFVLGTALMFILRLPGLRSNSRAVHTLIVSVAVVTGAVIVMGGQSIFFNALGRDSSLTGRTDIWSTVIPLAMNPVFGAGFESFWNAASQMLRNLPDVYQFGNLNSAHNGYIDVYLNLGLIGLGLVIWVVVSAYKRACAGFRRDPELGGLFIAYTITTAIYSITEAGFRVMTPTWICLLLAAFGGAKLAEIGALATTVGEVSPSPPDGARHISFRPTRARRPEAMTPRKAFGLRTSKIR